MSFTAVLNLSITASFPVLAVAVLRLVLKRAPRGMICALWALVALRLLVPALPESSLSLIPSREVVPETYLYQEPAQQSQPAKIEIVNNPNYDAAVTLDANATIDRVQLWDVQATIVWLAGIGAMGIYAVYSWLSLRLRLRLRVQMEKGVYECDDVDSPFILGVIRPKIYLPSTLSDADRAHVLAHERAHLKRLDHIWKLLGFGLLSIHWFNPVMWLGYVLLCRDIELACDEKVIKGLEKLQVRAYSEALVSCAIHRRTIAACPLAFGEVGVKGRIKNILAYKKPTFWILAIAILASVALAACFLTEPKQEERTWEDVFSENCTILHIQEEPLTLEIDKTLLPSDAADGWNYRFDPGLLIEEHDTNRIELRSARMSGDELLLEFVIVPKIEEAGVLLLPQHPGLIDPEREFANKVPEDWDRREATVTEGQVWDLNGVHAQAALRRGLSGDSFSIGVKLDVWNMEADRISMELSGIWSVQYTFGEPPAQTFPAALPELGTFAPSLPGSVDIPHFTLCADESFRLTTSQVSSYLGVGDYDLTGDTLTLATADGLNTWVFTRDGDDWCFEADRSSGIGFYPDLKQFSMLPDGTVFQRREGSILEDQLLDNAIQSAILAQYADLAGPGEIPTAAWVTLHSEHLSVTPLVGQTNHENLLIVYLMTRYELFTPMSSELRPETALVIPAALTFDLADYSLRDYRTPRDGSYYSEDLKTIFPPEAREELGSFSDNALLEVTCLAQAQKWLEENPTLDEQIDTLFSVICSSPAQYSYPSAYIDAHPEEVRKLLDYGLLTVEWCIDRFAAEQELGLEGMVMAVICQQIIEPIEGCTVEEFVNGEDWYRQMCGRAVEVAQEVGFQVLEKNHPACRLLVDSLLVICE